MPKQKSSGERRLKIFQTLFQSPNVEGRSIGTWVLFVAWKRTPFFGGTKDTGDSATATLLEAT